MDLSVITPAAETYCLGEEKDLGQVVIRNVVKTNEPTERALFILEGTANLQVKDNGKFEIFLSPEYDFEPGFDFYVNHLLGEGARAFVLDDDSIKIKLPVTKEGRWGFITNVSSFTPKQTRAMNNDPKVKVTFYLSSYQSASGRGLFALAKRLEFIKSK